MASIQALPHFHFDHDRARAITERALLVIAAMLVIGTLGYLLTYVVELWNISTNDAAIETQNQVVANVPMMVFTTLFTLTLVPATFGLTMMLLATIIGVFIPFVRDREFRAEYMESRRPGGHDEIHAHIPEIGVTDIG